VALEHHGRSHDAAEGGTDPRLPEKPWDLQHGCRKVPGLAAEARKPLQTVCLPAYRWDRRPHDHRGLGDRVTGTRATGRGAHGVPAAPSSWPCPAAVRSSRGCP